MFRPRGRNGHSLGEHVAADFVGIVDIGKRGIGTTLVVAPHTVATRPSPSVDGPAGRVVREVVCPGECGDGAAIQHIDHSSQCVAAISISRHDRDGIPSRKSIFYSHHRIYCHYGAIHQRTVPRVRYIAVHAGKHAHRKRRGVAHVGQRRYLPLHKGLQLLIKHHVVDIGRATAFAGADKGHAHMLAAPGVEAGVEGGIVRIFVGQR